jgi:hypothetical protein
MVKIEIWLVFFGSLEGWAFLMGITLIATYWYSVGKCEPILKFSCAGSSPSYLLTRHILNPDQRPPNARLP